MDTWYYYVMGPVILGTSLAVGYYDYLNRRKRRNQAQQIITMSSTDQPITQNDTSQSQFAQMSESNRERLQNSNNDSSLNMYFTPKPQESQPTVIMMPMPKQSKMPKPSKVHNNPKEKLPHFCKAPNDGDMIKRY